MTWFTCRIAATYQHDRSARRAVRVSSAHAASIEYIKAGKLRALAVTTATPRRCCRTSRRWAISCRDTRRARGCGSARRRTRPPRSSKLNREINAGLADRQFKAQFADLGARPLRLARRIWQAHRRRNREVGQGGEVRGAHQAGVIGEPAGTFHKSRSAESQPDRPVRVKTGKAQNEQASASRCAARAVRTKQRLHGVGKGFERHA